MTLIVTYGTSLTAAGGWQSPLREMLVNGGAGAVEIINKAKSGASSDWGVANIETVAALNPDVVLIEFATNDAALHRRVSRRRSRRNLEEMVAILRRRNPAVQIYFQGMSPVWGLKGWVRPRINAYMDDSEVLARSLTVGFIDHRDWWSRIDAGMRREMIPDGLHPDPERCARLIASHISLRIAGIAAG